MCFVLEKNYLIAVWYDHSKPTILAHWDLLFIFMIKVRIPKINLTLYSVFIFQVDCGQILWKKNIFVKRKFKQRWSTISSISTIKQTTNVPPITSQWKQKDHEILVLSWDRHINVSTDRKPQHWNTCTHTMYHNLII
jgi:hypothetical protein